MKYYLYDNCRFLKISVIYVGSSRLAAPQDVGPKTSVIYVDGPSRPAAPKDMGPAPMDMGPAPMNMGPALMDMAPAPMAMGPAPQGPAPQGPIIMQEGPGS